jgi:hypothetical protein
MSQGGCRGSEKRRVVATLSVLLLSCSVEDGILGGIRAEQSGISSGGGTDGTAESAGGGADGAAESAGGGADGAAESAGGGADGAAESAGGGADGAAESAGGGNLGSSAQCEALGPMVTLTDRNGTGSYETCTGRIAATYFLNALCSCNSAIFGNYLKTRGFDSSRGPYDPEQPDVSGASVGINGDCQLTTGDTDVGGSLSLAGPNGADLFGNLQVLGDFRAAGDITVVGAAMIARNAWLAGSYTGVGSLSVTGDLHHQGTVVALPVSAANDLTETVTLEKPCACEPVDLLDVGELVTEASTNNDNVRASLNGSELASVTGAASITLPCGRFYLDQIAGTGNVQLDVTGPVALFVGGSLDIVGNFEVGLSPGAEIDLFLSGDLRVVGQLSLASQDRPAAGRVYVGGAGNVELNGSFIGNLYAPGSRVSSSTELRVWGSIFAGDFKSSAYASFIYDRAVLAAGSRCNTPRPPEGSCQQCGWCSGGTACVDGTCGPCRTDEDCCSQSVCSNSSCVALVLPPPL